MDHYTSVRKREREREREREIFPLLFRKTFHVKESQLIAIYFQSPLTSSLLRVIDNDSAEEIPRVFQATVPHTYRPNGKGYTLQAEAWHTGVSSPVALPEETEDKKWRLRLVTSSRDNPPVLEGVSREEDVVVIDEAFHKQEIMDYCLPDREDILFRCVSSIRILSKEWKCCLFLGIY